MAEINKIGFWGYPKPEIIQEYKLNYPNAEWIDLDIDYNYPDVKFTPDAYCVIIKNICNNAFYLKDRLITILAPIGKDKCDSAYFVSEILKEHGFNIVQTVFEDKCHDKSLLKFPISKSKLPLREKIELITKNIVEQKESEIEKIREELADAENSNTWFKNIELSNLESSLNLSQTMANNVQNELFFLNNQYLNALKTE